MSGGLVLLYHRIACEKVDPQRLCVSPQNFAAHLRVMRAEMKPMALQALLGTAQGGGLADRVAVTFDDGYADNVDTALPLLQEAGVPATVFVASGFVESQEPFWWDVLQSALLEGRAPADAVERWSEHSGGAGGDSEQAVLEGNGSYVDWHVECEWVPTRRHALYIELCERLKSMGGAARRRVLFELGREAGADWGPRTRRAMSVEQLQRLAAGTLVDVGAHTVTHPVLASLPTDEQAKEIEGSKAALEGMVGRAVTCFSYPFGTRRDFGEESVSLVREAGFACACANTAGIVRRGTDPFRVPRILVRNWDADAFARRLRQWRVQEGVAV